MDKKALKRDQLIAASIAVMREQGFEKASVADIAKRAGVGKGTFYLYFSSKNAIVPTIAKIVVTELLDRVKQSYAKNEEKTEDPSLFVSVLIDEIYAITETYQELITFLYSGFAYEVKSILV
ncbi:MAG TPA: hypothetical protein DHN33_06770, partial [Eubacteriaceae bacterium]|nr:hypothetical protein [Eubacteriaceae bacterium]